MNYGYILFWDKQEKPLRITPHEHAEIMKIWRTADHLIVQGNIIHKSDIRRIKPPEKPKPFLLPEVTEQPIRPETIKKVSAEIRKKHPK